MVDKLICFIESTGQGMCKTCLTYGLHLFDLCLRVARHLCIVFDIIVFICVL